MAGGAPTRPDWVEPMAATLTQERFTGPEWTFERKLDGIRLLAFKDGRDVELFSRNRLPQNEAYPSIVEAIATLPVHDVILDGEGLGVWGRSGRTAFHVFDIVWLDGRDLTKLPLDERRALLDTLPLRAPLERVAALSDPHPWERACREGWEGVIAKRRDSPYEQRRSPHWLKMKCEATQEFVVGGFTDPQGSRVGLGALLVGYYDGDDFVFAGKLGTGFDRKLLLELRARLDTLERATPPFTKGTGLPAAPKRPREGGPVSPKRPHWVRPEIVVQVSFIEWTPHGKLRHPRLRGVRTDKAAGDVIREQP